MARRVRPGVRAEAREKRGARGRRDRSVARARVSGSRYVQVEANWALQEELPGQPLEPWRPLPDEIATQLVSLLELVGRSAVRPRHVAFYAPGTRLEHALSDVDSGLPMLAYALEVASAYPSA